MGKNDFVREYDSVGKVQQYNKVPFIEIQPAGHCMEKINEKFQSEIHFADIIYRTGQKFNWLQKKMLKTFLGLTIVDYKEGE